MYVDCVLEISQINRGSQSREKTISFKVFAAKETFHQKINSFLQESSPNIPLIDVPLIAVSYQFLTIIHHSIPNIVRATSAAMRGQYVKQQDVHGVARHLHRQSAYRVSIKSTSCVRLSSGLASLSPANNGRPIIIGSFFSLSLSLPSSYDHLEFPSIFSCFVAVSGQLASATGTGPSNRAAALVFLESQPSIRVCLQPCTVYVPVLSGSCIVDEDNHVTDSPSACALVAGDVLSIVC